MSNNQISRISTLGPVNTNSHNAVKSYIKTKNSNSEIILCSTVDESIDLLLNGSVDACAVCNLYPKIHELYIPNLLKISASDVFIDEAEMGLYKRGNVLEINTVASPITSIVFIQEDSFSIRITTSNSKAARMCKNNEVDAAISTKKAALENGLTLIRDFGKFNVPYTVFTRRYK